METKKCPACGSSRIGQGVFSGYANLTVCNSQGKAGFRSSAVKAEVCGDCGLILGLYAVKPEKFLPKEDRERF